MSDYETAQRTFKDVKTVEAAVDILLTQLPLDVLKELTHLTEDGLPDMHYSLGLRIRNILELWHNPELVEDCGADCADEAGSFILWALWK